MPHLTITLPKKQYERAKKQARAEGFESTQGWAEFLIERRLILEESPKIPAEKIIAEMEKTGLYQKRFLRGLRASLVYADKTAQ